MSRISVLGLGAMGSRMAVNFASAGHDVTVWNRTSAVADRLAEETRGLRTAPTPRAASAGAEFVVSMVSDDRAAVDVWTADEHGALPAMADDAVAIESSTLTPDTVLRIGDAASRADLRFVEAPVVGSRPQAEAGALFYLLGGDDHAVEAAVPVIDVNAGKRQHVGALGNAATMKLAINGLFAAQVAVYAEVAGLIERSDLDTTTALETLGALPITSPGLQRILGLMATRDYGPNFPIRLVAKDLGYLGRSAERLGAAIPIIDATSSVFVDAAADGDGNLDIAGLAARYQT